MLINSKSMNITASCSSHPKSTTPSCFPKASVKAFALFPGTSLWCAHVTEYYLAKNAQLFTNSNCLRLSLCVGHPDWTALPHQLSSSAIELTCLADQKREAIAMVSFERGYEQIRPSKT